ncbi:hypothetical protein BCR36DRAFT_301838 [Piromyces finnis]|uniref:LysM domain-containing protein n=1 Tax=Piromyces finnis TaxID=1754191 RepID=A0A1Y1V020_9FUNG|nr:hypothetical protein BCR36DRAFT_301838 [Piromyces finnis]|eukprot:ORX44394.1 hypothetical protein BCR36DRAFT_301838 [Piromyces finnis]
MKSFLFSTVFLLSTIAKVYSIGYTCKKHVVISEGDECTDIFGYDSKKDYFVKYDQLMLYNPNVDCDALFEREMICVEVDEKKSPKMLSYTLQPNDTWDSVAKKLHSSKQALYHTNLSKYF